MDAKVRDLFRMETKDIIKLEKFNEIYYVFDWLVKFDIDVPELEGLEERLSYALNIIATEKLDRNDIITFFPIIWSKFEVYVKQVLYIINREEYKKIRKRNGSIRDYLEGLGIKVCISQKEERNECTEAMFITYNLRNIEAHECEKWSNRIYYDKLANVLASFLIVTNKVLPDIQRIIRDEVPEEKKVEIPIFRRFNLLSLMEVNYELLFNITDLNNIKSIQTMCGGTFYSLRKFDQEGRYLGQHSESLEGEGVDECVRYEYENGRIKKQTKFLKESSGKIKGLEEYVEYKYNDIGDIERFTHYIKDKKVRQYIKKSEIEIRYMTDGKVSIIKTKYSLFEKHRKMRCIYQEMRLYDCDGKILEIRDLEKQGTIQFIYNLNRELVRIEYPDNSYDEIKMIADNMFKIHFKNDGDGFLREKRHFCENKKMSIKRYKEPSNLLKNDDLHPNIEKIFEYY